MDLLRSEQDHWLERGGSNCKHRASLARSGPQDAIHRLRSCHSRPCSITQLNQILSKHNLGERNLYSLGRVDDIQKCIRSSQTESFESFYTFLGLLDCSLIRSSVYEPVSEPLNGQCDLSSSRTTTNWRTWLAWRWEIFVIRLSWNRNAFLSELVCLASAMQASMGCCDESFNINVNVSFPELS